MYPGNSAKREAAIRNSAAAVHQPHFRPRGRREPPRHEGQAHKSAHRRHRRHEGGRVIRCSGPAVADEFRADPLEHLCRGRGRRDEFQRGRKGWVHAGLEREGDVYARERGGGEAEDGAVRGDGGGLEYRAAHAYVSAEAHPKLVSSSGDAPQMYAANARKSPLNPALRAITLRIWFPAASKGPVGLNPSTVPEPACAPHCSSCKAFVVERHRKAERRSLRNGGMWGWVSCQLQPTPTCRFAAVLA
ncbi:hypothetical protein B0H16DRAFT_1530759 [Mycena metata]|uniref:Uncharacterized protein n=1 Tax=Mycena metata TaxID=1033252 RepID=A0AAD7JBJ3_9AGAR|nr:hypothetical protein B0H16DRAFT_1530759 [Mycena metata]